MVTCAKLTDEISPTHPDWTSWPPVSRPANFAGLAHWQNMAKEAFVIFECQDHLPTKSSNVMTP